MTIALLELIRSGSLALQTPRSAQHLSVRYLHARYRGASELRELLLLAEPADHSQTSLANGAEYYWAESILRLGLQKRLDVLRLVHALQISPVEISDLQHVMADGAIRSEPTTWAPALVRFGSIGWIKMTKPCTESIRGHFRATFGGLAPSAPDKVMASP